MFVSINVIPLVYLSACLPSPFSSLFDFISVVSLPFPSLRSPSCSFLLKTLILILPQQFRQIFKRAAFFPFVVFPLSRAPGCCSSSLNKCRQRNSDFKEGENIHARKEITLRLIAQIILLFFKKEEK